MNNLTLGPVNMIGTEGKSMEGESKVNSIEYYRELIAMDNEFRKEKKKTKKAKKAQKKDREKKKEIKKTLKIEKRRHKDTKMKLKEAQMAIEFERKLHEVQMNSVQALTANQIKAVSRQMSLIALMQQPEVSPKIIDQYVDLACEVLRENCSGTRMIEGDANEV